MLPGRASRVAARVYFGTPKANRESSRPANAMEGYTATGLCKITYSNPFVHVLYVEYVNSYCFHCLRQLPHGEKASEIVRCSNCRFAIFCNTQCQQRCEDQFHKFECPFIAKAFPKAPSAHAILFARLIYRLKREKVDICAPYECRPVAPRTWKNLLSHAEDIKANAARMSKFELLKSMLSDYFKDAPAEAAIPEYTDDELFTIYCKKAVNSHGVFNHCGDCIGESLDFDASIYDHSCRPNLSITYDGVAITFALLDDMKNGMEALRDPSRVYVSYVELAMSRTRRRRLLKERYHFHCQCERCMDLEDDLMTSIKCANTQCSQPLIGMTEDGVPVNINCPVCRTTRATADIRQCQIMMRVIEKLTENWREPPSVGANTASTAEDIFKKCVAMYDRCKPYLHTTNLYLTDLRLTYVMWAMRTKLGLETALQMALESTKCVRLCYPRCHKLLGFHLLKIVYLYIAISEDYEKAEPYLDEASIAMLRWFGDEEHSVCQRLKTLSKKIKGALYGGETAQKEAMLELMKFY